MGTNVACMIKIEGFMPIAWHYMLILYGNECRSTPIKGVPNQERVVPPSGPPNLVPCLIACPGHRLIWWHCETDGIRKVSVHIENDRKAFPSPSFRNLVANVHFLLTLGQQEKQNNGSVIQSDRWRFISDPGSGLWIVGTILYP